MKKLLIINASPRTALSNSRSLTKHFGTLWLEHNPGGKITHRELGTEHVPHMSELWIASVYKPENLRTAEEREILSHSDEYIAELMLADTIILGTPMYNWSIPSSLKAYIDQIVRVGKTILINKENPSNPYIGLLKEKKIFLLYSRGNSGYDQGGYNEHMNFQTEYLKTVFRIMGLEDIREIALDGEAFGPEIFGKAVTAAHTKIEQMLQLDID
jgi:FMN-dependent NADH-azoreductase